MNKKYFDPVANNQAIGIVISNRNFGGQESRYLKIAYSLFHRQQEVKVFINKSLFKKCKNKYPEIWNDNSFMENVHIVNLTSSSIIQSLINLLLFHILKIDPFLWKAKKQILKTKPYAIISNKDILNLKTLRKYYKGKIIKDYTSPENVLHSFKRKDFRYFDTVNQIYFVSNSVKLKFDNTFNNNQRNSLTSQSIVIFKIPFYLNSHKVINYDKKINNIVFAHRFIKRKNPEVFAEVVIKFCEDNRYDAWNFSFFGRGPLNDKLRKRLKQQINEGRVNFGYIQDLNSQLLISKIFVSLIEPDNFPSQSIMEAMSTGNAILVLESGDSKRFIKKNGTLVEKDIDDILSKLKALTEENLSELGKNSENLVKDKFSLDKYLTYWTKNIFNK